ncbi:MAG TPA: hypothetical protein VFO80_07050, partial [Sphingomonas sp.]|nr:hypothetical protein [Sphingomonas sp.]
MLDILVALLLTWGALMLAGDTPAGRALRRMLVDAPAARLSRVTHGHVTLAILVFGGTGLLIAVLGHEAA